SPPTKIRRSVRMAQMHVFIGRGSEDRVLSSGSRFDGVARKQATQDRGRHPRHVLWTFQLVGEGEWGILFDHKHARALIAGENNKVTLGTPTDNTAWWKMKARSDGHVAFVPHKDETKALTHSGLNDPVTLTAIATDAAGQATQEWKPRAIEAAPSESI